MATFYFNGAVNGEWTELGNWWTDSAHTVPATALPAAVDDVVASASINSNSGPSPTVANFTLNDPAAAGYDLNIDITVTGNATFNGSSEKLGNVYGNATFNDSSYNYYGTVTDAVFNDSSINYSIVTGNATFNDSSINDTGTVGGDATFNDSSVNNGGTVGGDATFNDSSYNGGTVNGNATFNDSSYNGGTVTGDATFNDSSVNYYGTVNGNATFNDGSYNNGGSFANPITIVGKPIQCTGQADAFPFTRAQLGINGSSILGVI